MASTQVLYSTRTAEIYWTSHGRVYVHTHLEEPVVQNDGHTRPLDKSLPVLWKSCEITAFLPSVVFHYYINLTFPVGQLGYLAQHHEAVV